MLMGEEEIRSNHREEKMRLLVTGAGGRVASRFIENFGERYDLRLFDREGARHLERIEGKGELILGQLDDPECLRRCCEGREAVLHLAANPSTVATWDQLVTPNITGAYHVCEAACQAGVRRLVLISSINAMKGHLLNDPTRQVRAADPTSPSNLYGVTKCFLEALGQYYANSFGMEVVVLRFGFVFDPKQNWHAKKEDSPGEKSGAISWRDVSQLFIRALETPGISYLCAQASSDNVVLMYDNREAREILGFSPKDRMPLSFGDDYVHDPDHVMQLNEKATVAP